MNYLSFSTANHPSIVEKVVRPSELMVAGTSDLMSGESFPQRLPHRLSKRRVLVFSGIARCIHFCTGSTTNTKNMNQNFVLS